MADSKPIVHEESEWRGDFASARQRFLDSSLAATPSQRLAWLEEALAFAARCGALPLLISICASPHSSPDFPNDSPRGGRSILMFPEAKHSPAGRLQFCIRMPISRDVRPDLVPPPFRVRLWPSAMLWTSVPETTIYEHNYASAGKHEICTAACPDYGSVHSVP
jgi:hypothetical protein